MKSISIKLGFICATWLALASSAFALEGTVLIVNESVPVESISASALKDIYNAKTTYWDGGQAVVIAVLEDKTDGALKEVSGMDASQFKTFWQRLVFSGRGQQPKKASSTAALVALVASTKGAIALVPADADLKGVKKLEIK